MPTVIPTNDDVRKLRLDIEHVLVILAAAAIGWAAHALWVQ